MSELPEPELTGLEASLARLRPQVGGLNRDQVLFRAGQASAGRSWGWPAAALSFGVAIILAVAWWHQPSLEPEIRIVYVPQPAPPAPPPVSPEVTRPQTKPGSPPELAYLHLREQVLRLGVDGLPPLPPLPPASAERPFRVKDLLP